MKVKKIALVSGDEYKECEMNPIKKGILPEEMDSMIELSLGKTRIYVNAAMIVSLELDTQLEVL